MAGQGMTAVATPAVSRQRLLADVRDLAELVSEAAECLTDAVRALEATP